MLSVGSFPLLVLFLTSNAPQGIPNTLFFPSPLMGKANKQGNKNMKTKTKKRSCV